MDTNVSALDRSPLPFLFLMGAVKHLPRTGWLRTIETPETVASHSFRLALLGLFAPDHLDREKCILIGLCHDLAESVVGDIPTYAGVPKEQKHKLEYFGFRHIENLLKPFSEELAKQIKDAWLDYEMGRTAEGRWMKEMDKFECLVQAHEYEQTTRGKKDLEEFQGLSAKISSSKGKEWLQLLRQERSKHLSRRTQRLRIIFVTGDLSISNAQYPSLFKEFGLPCIALRDILDERSQDQNYLHAEYLRDCLEGGVDVPVDLLIRLLEQKIEEGMKNENGWNLVYGFPENMEQLHEFEKKVQDKNYTLFLNCSSERNSEHPIKDHGQPGIKEPDNSQTQRGRLMKYLTSTEGYFKEVNYDGSVDVRELVMKAVGEFIEVAERRE